MNNTNRLPELLRVPWEHGHTDHHALQEVAVLTKVGFIVGQRVQDTDQ